ncbi:MULTISPECIES: ABC transporter permease [Salipiger]|uniref:Peptide/nickel transport system permease protein n=1 Tax=Salipiger profundus TaxID=1229727 RepID=A0A1U7DDM5_9RHOB|nr:MULTISPECIES: ABC transporter permease [Salipiger]APX26261.1 peptide/nickel transport system permease protein [Salipiger profundus]GGA27537.1 peptide ABC transporter permease [Salipiger profundus]SFD74634.1 peptide/nickel transport system permease protein [Salipiger profundus]
MARFILHRLGHSLLLLFLVSLIGYTILHLAPGGPLSQYALSPGMTQAELNQIAERMGLNRPIPIQYLDWFTSFLVGDWGESFRDGRPVLSVISGHLFATVLLVVSSSVISIGLGTLVGVLGATRRYSAWDYIATVGAMIALSIPTFWFGLVAIYVFSLQLDWFPSGNMYSIGDESFLDYAHHLVMPSVVLALVSVAIWSRYMRSAMLDVIGQDFVRTARAKGLSGQRVLYRHVVRNALIPMITLAGIQLPMLLSGALVTETVFTWPGIGRLFLDSLGYNDYPVIMGVLMFTAIFVLLGNLIADILVATVDPRVRLE